MNQDAIPWRWFLLDINPEPWAIGDLSIGRRGGKMFPMVGRNQQLHFYKQAVREEVGEQDFRIDGPVELQFFFWRRMDEYKTPQARGARKNEADATNMQKATEDALQGLFFKNDKDVNCVRSIIVEQGPDVKPKVLVGIRPGRVIPDAFNELPAEVIELIDMHDEGIA